jgi:hypothetical protein
MPLPTTDDAWFARCRDVLSRYSEPLLRTVAGKLIKPRTNQPLEELLDKSISTLTNPPVIDRRIRELPESARKLLAFVGISRRPQWKIGHLITLVSAIGHAEGFSSVAAALEAGLLYPDLGAGLSDLEDFSAWLGSEGIMTAEVFAHPAVIARARTEDLALPTLSIPDPPPATAHPRHADGLDWLLRLAAVRQQVEANPVRFTQTNTLFKKDLTRLQNDEVLSASPIEYTGNLPDPGVFALLWAHAAGLLVEEGGDLRAAPFPASWDSSLVPVLIELYSALAGVEAWDPVLGYAPREHGLSPAPTAGLLGLLLLARVKPGEWLTAEPVADWLWTHHPSWAGTLPESAARDRGASWVQAFYMGVAYPLQLLEVLGPNVRLSPLGRHLLAGAPEPPPPMAFPQTLLIQPNAEILAYRQGLSPALIAALSRFARWKGLGPACTLELTPEQTYRGLESGLTLPMILQTLTRSASRPVPLAVADLLQRWASKRERITVYSSAVLVEFATPAELDTAVSRGIVAIRLTDRMGITADGTEPALGQLRLIANRDYEAKPQRCVTVADDGITLTIDAAAADLLLDAEISRFAAPVPSEPPSVRRYRLGPELLRRAAMMFPLAEIDGWFIDRSGQPLSPAGRLLLLGPELPPATAQRLMVVRFHSPDITDGVFQWPTTRALLLDRLGSTAVVVAEENLDSLRRVLEEIGVRLVSQ